MEIAQQTAAEPQRVEVGEPGAVAPVTTEAKYANTWRKVAFDVGAIAAPLALGIVTGLRTGRPGRGFLAGAGAALALGALRMQMARWFTEMPDYERVATAGGLELRQYAPFVEASTMLDAPDIETALDAGFDRLACFLFGMNDEGAEIPMTAPVLASMVDGAYRVSFVMPPGRTLGSLPTPTDSRVELHERPARHVAALKFHGRFTPENIHDHERTLLGLVVDAGLVGRGSVTFAGYDAPLTLPFLRRNELWLEVI